MFTSIQGLLNKLLADISTTFITFFIIGIAVTGLLAAFGGEEHKSKFKGAFFLCLVGLVVFSIAEPIVTYFQTNLK